MSRVGCRCRVRSLNRIIAASIVLLCFTPLDRAAAQAPGVRPSATPTGSAALQQAEALAAQALAAPGPAPAPPPAPTPKKEISVWELAIAGGPLMIPIFMISIVVVCFAFERAFALRKRKLLPPELVSELGELSLRGTGVDPRGAYRACQRHPSTAATVLKAVLLKIGRPHSEMELTLKEVNEREAAQLYKNVRPIELAVSVAPLLGLLGTVQGMIMAFFVTANADIPGNKAEKLAQGIYVALVTTFAGLVVAIPAAMLAHYFEGRIQAFFRDLNELILSILPQWERYEGKLRVNRQMLSAETEPASPAVEPPPIERPTSKVAHN